MRCANCGTENEERNVLCSNCGSELNYDSGKFGLLRNKIFIGASLSVLIIVIILLITLFNTIIFPNQAANKMKNALESKLGENVITVFDQYCGDFSVIYEDLSKAGKAVFLEFEEFISAAEEEMNNQPIETDINSYLTDTMGDIVLPQENSAINVIAQYNGELNSVVTSYYELYNSKISYTNAIEQYTSNNLSSAISLFNKVIERDSWYENAKEKLTECQSKLLEEQVLSIDEYINNGDYNKAQQLIKSLRSNKLNDELNAALDEYETKIYEAKLAKIDEYVNNGDFDAANEYIETLSSELSSEAKERLNKAIKNKANDYITKADEALKSGERQGAYDMALMAQNLCPDDEEIIKKVEYFKDYLPFKLYLKDNTISYSDDDMWGYTGGVNWNEKLTSNNNTTMEQCIDFYYQSEYKGQFNITYTFGGKYDSISGAVFLPEKYKNHKQNGYFKVYGDGKLLYTSKNITKNVMPSDFSVNVTGVDVLTVKFFGSRTEDWSLGDGWSGYAISSFIATKNLP